MIKAVLFDMDGVHLEFEDAALHAIAHRAVERKTGALKEKIREKRGI